MKKIIALLFSLLLLCNAGCAVAEDSIADISDRLANLEIVIDEDAAKETMEAIQRVKNELDSYFRDSTSTHTPPSQPTSQPANSLIVDYDKVEQLIALDVMTYPELLYLQEKIGAEIASRKEGNEIVVPGGVYEIGVDIPEGYWDITLIPLDVFYNSVSIDYGKKLDASKTKFAYRDEISHNLLSDTKPTWSINLTKGNWIIIDSYVVFTPHVQPSLGF